MSKKDRIEALKQEFLPLLQNKPLTDSKRNLLALEFATRLEKTINPGGSKTPRINIEDTFNQNKKITITLRNPVSTDIEEVLEDYLDRMGNSRPNIRYWDIQQAVGSMLTLGTTYICTLVETPTMTSAPRSTSRKEAKVASNIFDNFSELPPERQQEILDKLGGQKKG